MTESEQHPEQQAKTASEHLGPCLHDLLEAALATLWPSDAQLEAFADTYERLP